MTTITDSKKTSTFALFAALAIGAQLEGGLFAGVITLPSGAHVAVTLLAAKPDGPLTWAKAKEWAESAGGELPSRPAAAMLFANLKSEFEEDWHWTCETASWNESFAWFQLFFTGGQSSGRKGSSYAARAVRLIHLVD